MAVGSPDSTWAEPVKGGRLATWASRIWEIERERLAVWSPLLLVVGIIGYFSLPQEPSIIVALAGILSVALVFWRRPGNHLLVAIAQIIFGFSIAILRAEWAGTPLLRATAHDVQLTGYVHEIERRSKRRDTMVLQVIAAPELPPGEVPRRIRLQLSIAADEVPRVGDIVQLKASLSPLPRPVFPGGFDFGRQLYFQGIGATGRSLAPPVILPADTSWRYTLRRTFHDLREAIGRRIRASITGPLGAIAEALITGERASIPRSMNESLQTSGLFHVLSISGLHMSMVAGGAFWFTRALLAVSPMLALNYPIKKWAAAVAILVGLLYLLLADSGPATDRAFIMIAVIFFAVIVDRPAISLHNLAVAAVIILMISPEQAVNASFQMSFMAVMGIAALYPALARFSERLRGSAGQGRSVRWLRWLLFWGGASVATSLVAGALSGIPAAHHFGRLAPYGVIANALALPIVGVVVMPSAMASVLLMPLGLEAPPLYVMEKGLEVVLQVSDWVASWPLAAGRWPLLPASATGLFAASAAFLCLSASPLRLLALPLALAACLAVLRSQSLLMIDDRAANIAIVTEKGWSPAIATGASFSVGKWLEQSGDSETVRNAAKRPGWSCSAFLCLSEVKGLTVGYLRRAAEGRTACPAVDILVAEFPLRRRCKGKHVSIDRFSVWREGSHALFLDNGKIVIRTAKTQQGLRPWVYESRARNRFSGKSP
jgi:competence protein ComEC